MSPVSLGHIECTPNGKGQHRSKLLNGENIGWLSHTQLVPNDEHMGVAPPHLPPVWRAQGCAPDQEGAPPERDAHWQSVVQWTHEMQPG